MLDVTMGHSLLCALGFLSLNTLLYCGNAQDFVLTIEPNWSTLFTRESVTLICDIREGEDTDWYYTVMKDGQAFFSYHTSRSYTLQTLVKGDSGEYQCLGHYKKSPYLNKQSNKVSLIVSDDDVILEYPASPLYEGESVTLRCRHRTQSKEKNASFYKDGSLISKNTAEITIQLQSEGSSYMCKFDEDEESKSVKLKVESNRPKARLSKDSTAFPAGGNVTLTCTVMPPSLGWTYFWYRGRKSSEALTARDVVVLSNEKILVSRGGLYWCRGGRGNPVYYTEYSDSIVTNRAAVILQPSWPEIYYGDTITLKCDIGDGGDAEWEYEWSIPGSYTSTKHNEYRITYVSYSQTGHYRCIGRVKDGMSSTEWSDTFILSLSDNEPKPVLTVSPLWLSSGDSVTLTCEVEHPSAGWRYYWYKAVPKLLQSSYSYVLLPGSTNGTAQDSYVVNGPTHAAQYLCRAGRGNPVHFTFYSASKFVWSGDIHPAASLSVSPDRVQHLFKESVLLRCDGNSTMWRVSRFGSGYLLSCSYWGTMTGSTCNIRRSQKIDGVYWCESETGQFSNAVNISGQHSDVILVSPVHPVAEGDSVTLSCKLKTENVPSRVTFYKNGKLIQNDTRRVLTIPAVSKSDEGFYNCKAKDSREGWLTSSKSWMSVKSVSGHKSSPFPVLWIIGLVSGVLLIVLLLLCLYHYTKSKDSCFIRSKSTNQGSAPDHMIDQDETHCKEYASSLHGAPLYESIKHPEEAENDQSSDVTYSLIVLKKIAKKGKTTEPEESAVYSDVKIGSAADDSTTYAEVRSHSKANKDKGKSSPAASPDETVYSEVKPGTALDQ